MKLTRRGLFASLLGASVAANLPIATIPVKSAIDASLIKSYTNKFIVPKATDAIFLNSPLIIRTVTSGYCPVRGTNGWKDHINCKHYKDQQDRWYRLG